MPLRRPGRWRRNPPPWFSASGLIPLAELRGAQEYWSHCPILDVEKAMRPGVRSLLAGLVVLAAPGTGLAPADEGLSKTGSIKGTQTRLAQAADKLEGVTITFRAGEVSGALLAAP